MIFCPYCGFSLDQTLKEGISTCINCHRTFDASKFNRLLSAAWCVRRMNLNDVNDLRRYNNLTEDELDFINHHVVDKGLTHDRFLKLFEQKDIVIL